MFKILSLAALAVCFTATTYGFEPNPLPGVSTCDANACVAAPLNVETCFSPCEPGCEYHGDLSCCRCSKNGDCVCDACCCHYGSSGDCHCCCKKRKRCCCCLFEESTCDMYPHYAYDPVFHGYYYFRPYNYRHIALHQQISVSQGGTTEAPYSTAHLAAVYREVESGYDAPAPVKRPQLKRFSPALPDLQEILAD